MIVGQQECFQAVGMDPAADLDQLRATIEAAVADVSGDGGALVLVDVMGGSPANASAYLAVAGTPVVCGVNLPMLLELLTQRESLSGKQLVELALASGRDGILDFGRQLTGAQG
jgi:PTS system mannose-specific IIA component